MVIWNPKVYGEQLLPHLLFACVWVSHTCSYEVHFSLFPESTGLYWIIFFSYCTTFIYNIMKKKINNETWIIIYNVTGFYIPYYWRLIYLSFAICWHLIKNQNVQKWVMALWVFLSVPFTFMAVSEREGVSYPNPLRASNRKWRELLKAPAKNVYLLWWLAWKMKVRCCFFVIIISIF